MGDGVYKVIELVGTSAESWEDAAKKAMEHGMKTVSVYLKGPGAGREPAVRAIAAA